MKDYFSEILFVIASSFRIQAAIILGMVGFIIINLLGDYFLADFQLSGNMSPLSEIIRSKLLHRYDKAAWVILFSFWWLAIKFYRKDKRKIWNRF